MIKRDPPSKHLVVVDTNILWDKDKKNAACPDFDRFWKSNLTLIPLELHIPEVVFGELHFQQTTSAQKLSSSISESLVELCGITQSKYVHKVEEHKVKTQVGQKIEKWMKGLGGVVIPTPIESINWSEVVASAIWRNPPFTFDPKDKNNEKGFRDALILETVVSLSQSSASTGKTVIFLCNDFLLRTEAEKRLKHDKKFLAFESIADFQSYIQLTQQELTEKFVKAIQAHARVKFFKTNDPNCLYSKEKLRERICQQFSEDINASPHSVGTNALSSLLDATIKSTLPKVAERFWINATQFEHLVGDREFNWVSGVTIAQLFEGVSQGVGGLLGTPLQPEGKIKLINFDIKWKANVKADGRFHDPRVMSIEKRSLTIENSTEETTARWRLIKSTQPS